MTVYVLRSHNCRRFNVATYRDRVKGHKSTGQVSILRIFQKMGGSFVPRTHEVKEHESSFQHEQQPKLNCGERLRLHPSLFFSSANETKSVPTATGRKPLCFSSEFGRTNPLNVKSTGAGAVQEFISNQRATAAASAFGIIRRRGANAQLLSVPGGQRGRRVLGWLTS